MLIIQNPDLKNTDISKLLGHEWRKAPIEIRQPHVEREQLEREAYLERMAEWRHMRNHEEDLIRKERIAVAEHCVQSIDRLLPREAMSELNKPFMEAPNRESFAVTSRFAHRFHLPAPLFESCSFSKTYLNPNIPAVTFPWSDGQTAGYFHALPTGSAEQGGKEKEESAPSTIFSENALVAILPRPQQLPQAPFEVTNQLREEYHVEAIPFLPFGKYEFFVSKLQDDDYEPKYRTLTKH
jgi:hypothetical protein